MIKVVVHLVDQSQPIVYKGVKNAYVKSEMYCVYLKDEIVHKFPLCHIWRVIEEYGTHDRGMPSLVMCDYCHERPAEIITEGIQLPEKLCSECRGRLHKGEITWNTIHGHIMEAKSNA